MIMKTYKESQKKTLNIKEMPNDQKPREKIETYGSTSLSDLELVAILIGSGTPRIGVYEVARKVLDVLDQAPMDNELGIADFTEIKGIGLAKAAVISAALEIGRRRMPQRRKQIIFPKDVFPLIRHYGNRNQEHFLTISLNGAHEVVTIQVVSIGLVNHTLVHPREVFADPLRQRATAVIVAHNHPSGNLNPSPDDINVTLRLKKAG
ncbi:MAG: DNA repair protein RadC, partial [Sphaerochaetaceae bacterium]|nr:DNA repair protein RadC [Sphaerochaetaceae bacterium]